VQDDEDSTPLLLSCSFAKTKVVKLLLKDPRVDLNLTDYKGRTALWKACYWGFAGAVKWLIACGRDLGDLDRKGLGYNGKEYSALEIARQEKKTELVTLLEGFVANPAQVRHEVRVKLRFPAELAAGLFAITVFLCDGLLRLQPANPNPAAPAIVRFLMVAIRLPMELEMVLCHRVMGSMRQNIRSEESEAAFKSLARILLPLEKL